MLGSFFKLYQLMEEHASVCGWTFEESLENFINLLDEKGLLGAGKKILDAAKKDKKAKGGISGHVTTNPTMQQEEAASFYHSDHASVDAATRALSRIRI
jgi:hypothetical protein